MLLLENVTKCYGEASKRTVLAGVDLHVARGEYVAIMGESGVGKSTLLNLIAGLDRPDSGAIRLDDTLLSDLDDDALTLLRRRLLGFVFQAFHVLPHLTVARNVALPLVLNRVPREESARRVAAGLAEVGLAGREHDFPRQLSGGEIQRVAIARALIHRPRLVLADEPTGNLDPDTAHNVLAVLRARVKDSGASAVLVTHSRAAAATTDRVYLLTARGLQPA